MLFIDLSQIGACLINISNKYDKMPYFKTKFRWKVFNKTKNLFCYVAHYCNLVAEFNGLVSKKGPVLLPAFLFV